MNITDSIFYIGVDDKDLDLFESQYVIPNGISYNSYVIMDDKIAVMDTVDNRKTDEWFANLEKVLDGKTPEYLVISHMEPDHAANIQRFTEKYPKTKLVGNVKTFSMLPQFFETDFSAKQVVVKEGENLSLGKHTLQFFMAPMVHWPEVMVTYDEYDKVVFSADAFGKFGALDTDEDWDCEARRYYFNIVGKYGAQVQALLKKLSGIDVEKICPLHGPILDANLSHYIGKYDTWSKYEPENKGVTVVYASIHGNTATAAKKMAEILESKGEKVSLFDLSRDDMAEAIEDSFRYDGLVLACSTYDGGLFPVMEDYLSHLKAKTFRNRTVALIENGSWAAISGRKMREALETMKDVTVLERVVSIKSSVKQNNIDEMEVLADELIASLNR